MRYSPSYQEAQESFNTGFLRILNNLDKYKPEVPFKKWIRKVQVNVLINAYHKNKKNRETMLYVENIEAYPVLSELNDAIENTNVDEINRIVAKLPPTSRKVFQLFVIDGFDHSEIGEMLGISENTSKWHLHFSREKLKGMLSQHNHLIVNTHNP
jgi:RNA polymerase sigma-70 factor (ECF subfamily)